MCVLDVEEISALLSVVDTAEKHIDFLESLALGFRDKEDDEDDEAKIGCHEEVEGITMKWSVYSL